MHTYSYNHIYHDLRFLFTYKIRISYFKVFETNKKLKKKKVNNYTNIEL